MHHTTYCLSICHMSHWFPSVASFLRHTKLPGHYLQFQIIKYFLFNVFLTIHFFSCFPLNLPDPPDYPPHPTLNSLSLKTKKKKKKVKIKTNNQRLIRQKIMKMETKSPRVKWSWLSVGQLLLGMEPVLECGWNTQRYSIEETWFSLCQWGLSIINSFLG